MFSTAKDVLEYVKKNGILFFDFRFTDIKGTWHHVSFNQTAVNEDTFKGLPFDGSSIPYWQSIDQSDMLLMPDAKSAFIDPFYANPTMVVFCDVFDIYKNQPYEKCPRSIAKKALKFLADAGIADQAYFGPENEFFIFDSLRLKDDMNVSYYEVDSFEGQWNSDVIFDDQPNTGHRPDVKGGYFPSPPVDTQNDIRQEMVKVLDQIGLETNVFHHEVGQAQAEIGVKFGDLITAADNVQKLKYVVKNVAAKYGKSATFMPKPLYGDNGSGMHTHQSLWKGNQPLFAGNAYEGLSELALNYVAGIFRHAKAVAAFTNASTNSYKRLQPGFEAPSTLTYSAQNRSASCRIPYVSAPAAKRVEMRFPDSTANPYLAFAAMMMAGIDGVQSKLDPGKPAEENLYDLSMADIKEKGLPQLPFTLREALDNLKGDNSFLKQGDVFTETFLETYNHYKIDTEVIPWEGRPHPYEFKTTWSC